MYFSPPDHPKCPGFGLGLRRIFRAKYPFFGVAVLGNEYPVLENEYRKNAGISRVKKKMKQTEEVLLAYPRFRRGAKSPETI